MRSTLCRSASWPKNTSVSAATSTPAERVFSTGGNPVICRHRSQTQQTGLRSWHVILKVMYARQGHCALFKKHIGNDGLFFLVLFFNGAEVAVSPSSTLLRNERRLAHFVIFFFTSYDSVLSDSGHRSSKYNFSR